MDYTTKAQPADKRIRKYTGDYVGMRFGNLVVIGYPVTSSGIRRAGAYCECDCGNIELVFGMGKLFSGRIASCKECRKKHRSEAMKRRWRDGYMNHKRSKYGDLRKERLFTVWNSMKSRCGSDCYKDVTVCDEWQDYRVFREWAYSHGYDDKAPRGECTIDRINPFGNYEPSNCRFADTKTQARNKRSRWLTLDEETREMLLRTTASN